MTFDKRPQKSPKPFKPKAWTHQDDLRAQCGKGIFIRFMNGVGIEGTLISADQFTLKIMVNSSKSVVTYFKHAVESYIQE